MSNAARDSFNRRLHPVPFFIEAKRRVLRMLLCQRMRQVTHAVAVAAYLRHLIYHPDSRAAKSLQIHFEQTTQLLGGTVDTTSSPPTELQPRGPPPSDAEEQVIDVNKTREPEHAHPAHSPERMLSQQVSSSHRAAVLTLQCFFRRCLRRRAAVVSFATDYSRWLICSALTNSIDSSVHSVVVGRGILDESFTRTDHAICNLTEPHGASLFLGAGVSLPSVYPHANNVALPSKGRFSISQGPCGQPSIIHMGACVGRGVSFNVKSQRFEKCLESLTEAIQLRSDSLADISCIVFPWVDEPAFSVGVSCFSERHPFLRVVVARSTSDHIQSMITQAQPELRDLDIAHTAAAAYAESTEDPALREQLVSAAHDIHRSISEGSLSDPGTLGQCS